MLLLSRLGKARSRFGFNIQGGSDKSYNVYYHSL